MWGPIAEQEAKIQKLYLDWQRAKEEAIKAGAYNPGLCPDAGPILSGQNQLLPFRRPIYRYGFKHYPGVFPPWQMPSPAAART